MYVNAFSGYMVHGRNVNKLFEGALAARRATAGAAETEWKSAVYRRVSEEVKANRGLCIRRMLKLGWARRSGFHRIEQKSRTRVAVSHNRSGGTGLWRRAGTA